MSGLSGCVTATPTQDITFSIVSRDADGVPLTSGGLSFGAVLFPAEEGGDGAGGGGALCIPVAVTDDADGRYTCRARVTEAQAQVWPGNGDLPFLCAVSLCQVPLPHSPFAFSLQAHVEQRPFCGKCGKDMKPQHGKPACYRAGSQSCDACGRRSIDSDPRTWHCSGCKYDLCEPCAAVQARRDLTQGCCALATYPSTYQSGRIVVCSADRCCSMGRHRHRDRVRPRPARRTSFHSAHGAYQPDKKEPQPQGTPFECGREGKACISACSSSQSVQWLCCPLLRGMGANAPRIPQTRICDGCFEVLHINVGHGRDAPLPDSAATAFGCTTVIWARILRSVQHSKHQYFPIFPRSWICTTPPPPAQ